MIKLPNQRTSPLADAPRGDLRASVRSFFEAMAWEANHWDVVGSYALASIQHKDISSNS